MAASKDLTFGLIGCGGIMGWHIGNLQKIAGVTVGALADTSEKSIENTKKRFQHLAQASTYTNHRDLLRDSRVDAVIIASRHVDHYPQVVDALNAGCHVLVEKPFVGSVAQAKTCIALAKKKGKTLMISYQRHFDPKFRYMRRLVQDGRIGKLQTICSALGQGWLEGCRGSWRHDPKASLGGQLNDSGSHVIDIALWISGLKPVEVYSNVEKCDVKVDINSATTVRLEKDVVWSINICGNTPGFWEYLVLAGDKGTIAYLNGDLTVVESGIRMKGESFGNYHDQTAGFVKAVRGEGSNEVPGEFGLLVTALTQSAFRAADSGKPVKIRL
ncbi:MAG: Gfo/Idh/MocA family oxidoreductase [Candidatus Coatesbacteria bacterium]